MVDCSSRHERVTEGTAVVVGERVLPRQGSRMTALGKAANPVRWLCF
jgi:hypothetical protein